MALVGHRSSGKTSLGELLLQAARVTRSVGSVEAGTSLLDHTAECRERKMSCGLSTAWIEHEGRELVLVDTPGSPSLAHEQARGVHVADLAAVVVDGARGIEIGTERAIRSVATSRRPAFVVVTKLDRRADLDELVGEAQRAFRAHRPDVLVVPLHRPLHDDRGELQGLVDVLGDQVLRYAPDSSGALSPEPIPQGLLPTVHVAREAVSEAVAMSDDALLEQYLEDLELPPAVLVSALASGIAEGRIVPLLLTSAVRHIGAGPLLDALARLTPPPRQPRLLDSDGAEQLGAGGGPEPDPFVAEVVACPVDEEGHTITWLKVWSGVPPRGAWRVAGTQRTVRIGKLYRVRGPRRATVANPGPGALVAAYEDLGVGPGATLTDGVMLRVIGPPRSAAPVGLAIAGEGLAQAQFDGAVEAVVRRDGALRLQRDAVTGATLLFGLTEGHLQLAIRRLARQSGAEVSTSLPPVGYLEALAGPVDRVEAVHEVRGDHGLVSEYGRCELALVPQDPGVVRFVDCAESAEDLPTRFRPAVGEGSTVALRHGPLAGYPVVGAEVRLTGGDYDMLCSTEEHFRWVGEKATRAALALSGTRLLEPWYEVRIDAPQDNVGELLSDIATHRGRVVGMEVGQRNAEIRAQCPYRELRTFASRLEALTGGRGAFVCDESHHEPVPEHLVAEAIRDSPFRRTC